MRVSSVETRVRGSYSRTVPSALALMGSSKLIARARVPDGVGRVAQLHVQGKAVQRAVEDDLHH